jgi:hypothetical protein
MSSRANAPAFEGNCERDEALGHCFRLCGNCWRLRLELFRVETGECIAHRIF